MDLQSLLNQGGSGLTTDDLLALQHCDNNEKLNKLNGVVFDYPSSSIDTYRFFDAFIQLVLSIQDDDDEFGLQYANTMIISALRTCINGLLQQEGFQWLVSYPTYLSEKTWLLLESRSDTTFLNYLYGLTLGLKKQDSISYETWVRSILYFLRAKVPPLTCHIWLNFTYLDDRHQGQVGARAAFLAAMEDGFSSTLPAFMETMTGATRYSLINTLETGLGGTLIRDPYTQKDITSAVAALEHSIRSHRTSYPLLAQELNRFLIKHVNAELVRKPAKLSEKRSNQNYLITRYPNLITKSSFDDLPLVDDTQSRLFQQAKRRWVQAMGVFLPDDFGIFLQRLVVSLYPSKNTCILDSVLVDWAARDPFGCHLVLIVDSVMRLMNSYNYDKTWSPYNSWIQAFELTGDGKGLVTTEGYNIKTGAEINLSKFSTKHDAVIVKGLGKILQQMTLRSTPTSSTWMVDCLLVASPDVIRQYFDWLIQQVNQEFDTGKLTEHNIMPFASHLHGILARQDLYPIAPFVVPSLLRRASEHTLAWMIQKKTDRVGYLKTDSASRRYPSGQIIAVYFDGGTDLSSKHLVSDLLRHKTRNYMDYLLTYLLNKSRQCEPTQKGTQSWLSRHFMEAILLEASNNSTIGDGQQQEQQQQQYSVAAGLYRRLLQDHTTFEWIFTTPYLAVDSMHISINYKYTNIVKTHTVMSLRETGMATLLHCVTQLDDSRQQHLTGIWMDLWTTGGKTMGSDIMDLQQETRLCVPDSMVLQCIGLYDQAPVIMRQMMEQFMKLSIQTRLHNGKGQVETTGQQQTFNEKVMDLLMLSDAPEVDGLLDLYLQLSYTFEATSETDQEEMVQAVVTTLIELTGEFDVLFKYPLYQKSSGRQLAGPKPEPTRTLDEFDEYTRIAESGTTSSSENSTDEWFENNNNINNNNSNDNTLISGKSRRLRQSLLQKQGKKHGSLAKALVEKKMDEQQWTKRRRRYDHPQDDDDQVHQQRRKRQTSERSITSKEESDRLIQNEVLVTLLQRLLNFILVVVSGADESSLCPAARKSVRNKMVRNYLLYESLATLNQHSEMPAHILNDIQVIIDISIDSLDKDGDTVTPTVIQRILTPPSLE
ncbi:hypothetical protein BC941DRAFT_509479 [Chlamydoabsidia padenii]|nr:hypothetical protein BC941DRAFT_509479 [Chlamydoabsidia padenii]